MKKPIPTFKTDREAEEFVANADLSDYNLSGGRIVRFETRPKDRPVSLRLPEKLLDAVRGAAKREGIPYQRFIRTAIESALHEGCANDPNCRAPPAPFHAASRRRLGTLGRLCARAGNGRALRRRCAHHPRPIQRCWRDVWPAQSVFFSPSGSPALRRPSTMRSYSR